MCDRGGRRHRHHHESENDNKDDDDHDDDNNNSNKNKTTTKTSCSADPVTVTERLLKRLARDIAINELMFAWLATSTWSFFRNGHGR